MTKKTATHVGILLCAILVTFFWVTDDVLANLSLQLTAVLLIILIISHHIIKPASFRLVESTISTMCVLLVTTTTGGVSSPLFFLNFFLLFELALLLEPAIPIVVSVILIPFYIGARQVGPSLYEYIALFSFPFMTPLAYLFGKIYQKEENQKKEIKNLSKEISTIKDQLVKEELLHSNAQSQHGT